MVHNREQPEALKRAVVPSSIKVWLKIDTGMHRLGVSLDEVDYFLSRAEKTPLKFNRTWFCESFEEAAHENEGFIPTATRHGDDSG